MFIGVNIIKYFKLRPIERNICFPNLLFCYMSQINKIICTYITQEWLIPWLNSGKSQRAFADYHNIEESTVRKIKSLQTYRVPVETLEKICEAKNISLSEFFKRVEEFSKGAR